MCSGGEFPVWAAATGKARLPTVASMTGGTTRRLVPAEHSSLTRDINGRGERPQILWCVAVEDSVCQHGDFELNLLRHTQPVLTDKSVSNVVGVSEMENQPCSSVQC